MWTLARYFSGALVIVAAATGLEAWAARRALRGTGVEVLRLGIGRGGALWVHEGAGPVVVTGLCGALAPLQAGTVVVPDEVALSDGRAVACDADLVARLRAAVLARGWPLATGRQLTAPVIVRGADRARWAGKGFETVDMEAALVLGRTPGASVRVVLDAPDHELPVPRELCDPRRWPGAARIVRDGPRYARRAAEVVSVVARGG